MSTYIYDTALFDLDGTLTDSAEGILNSARYALTQMGREALPDETLKKFLGPPLVVSFHEYCNMSEQEAKEATRIFRVRYTDIGLFENRPYEGIREMLERLKASGIRLATATSKPEDYARRIRMQARWTKDRKREASLSKRVATLRNSLSLRKKVSTR